MPSVTLALFFIARIARLTRSGMLNVLRNDYVRTARAKGLSSTMVVLKHALRNASLAIVTIVAIESEPCSGTVITETVFAWPGLGRLAVDAIFSRDYPVVQTVVLLISVIFVSLNFLVDLFYRLIDPRIELVVARRQRSRLRTRSSRPTAGPQGRQGGSGGYAAPISPSWVR